MARPTVSLTTKHYAIDFRLAESASPKYKFALETMHYGKPHEADDPYLPQWDKYAVAKHTGLLVSSINAIGFKNYAIVNGEQLYAPITIYLSIIHRATKRKQSVDEYIATQNEASRRRNSRNRPPTQTDPTTADQIVAIIHHITKDRPKARAVFERELRKINVSLPELE